MSAGVRIIRLDHTASELRALAAKSLDGAEVRRLLALALVLEGHRRAAAAALTGMDLQTLRDWVHRYNAEGVAGLASRVGPGPARRLNDEQMAALKALVVAGPNPDTDGVVRWRCVDLREQIIRRFSVTLHERSVGKLLRQLRLTRLQPRPSHPKKDAEAQEAFKKTSLLL